MKTVATAHPGDFAEVSVYHPVYQAYQILHWGFVILPVIAGIDKFFNRLTDWSMYLWTPLGRFFGGPGHFMAVVGVIEIVAACLVAVKPKVGAPILEVWLVGIIGNLLLHGHYLDIALRDFGLFLAAVALSRLAAEFDHPVHASEKKA